MVSFLVMNNIQYVILSLKLHNFKSEIDCFESFGTLFLFMTI